MSYNALLQTTATYWAVGTPDGFGGVKYATPATLLCRWEDKTETYQDTEGEEFISSAIIYTTTQLLENGWLYRGSSVAANPQDVNDAFRIRRIERTQTPDGSIVIHKNILG